MNLEVETKLSASVDYELPLTQFGNLGFKLSVEPVKDTTTTYFDTKQSDLLAGGAALRFRSLEPENETVDGIWALKFSAHQRSHVTSRYECEIKGKSHTIPAVLVEALKVYGAKDRLEPIATLRALRQTVHFLDTAGKTIFVLDDDRVAIEKGPNKGSEFREIEVELLSQSHQSDCESVVKLLRDAGARFAMSSSKLEQAIANEKNMRQLKVNLDRYTTQISLDLTALAFMVLLNKEEPDQVIKELAKFIVIGMSESSAQRLVAELVHLRLSNPLGVELKALDGIVIDLADSLRLGRAEKPAPLESRLSAQSVHQIVSMTIELARKRGADSIGDITELLRDIFSSSTQSASWIEIFMTKWS